MGGRIQGDKIDAISTFHLNLPPILYIFHSIFTMALNISELESETKWVAELDEFFDLDLSNRVLWARFTSTIDAILITSVCREVFAQIVFPRGLQSTTPLITNWRKVKSSVIS